MIHGSDQCVSQSDLDDRKNFIHKKISGEKGMVNKF
jgi:hypothetical protein